MIRNLLWLVFFVVLLQDLHWYHFHLSNAAFQQDLALTLQQKQHTKVKRVFTFHCAIVKNWNPGKVAGYHGPYLVCVRFIRPSRPVVVVSEPLFFSKNIFAECPHRKYESERFTVCVEYVKLKCLFRLINAHIFSEKRETFRLICSRRWLSNIFFVLNLFWLPLLKFDD